MRRTRKWSYVAQEAQRLADLNLSCPEIAKRLGVQRQTVTRWIASGKLSKKIIREVAQTGVEPGSALRQEGQWAASVRRSYDLDATDDQLVDLAEIALLMARNPAAPDSLRLQAMSAYKGIVKQLSLVARAADAKADEAPPRALFHVEQRTGTDPRGILSGVK